MAKVLVVDDEPSILEMLRINLDLRGHDSYLASDGETALKRIQAETPDVVLLDIMMPVLDGWEVLRRLSEASLRKRPRVVILTAKSTDRDIAKGLDLGACDYVPKPFELERLMDLVDRIAESSEEELARRRAKLIQRLQGD